MKDISVDDETGDIEVADAHGSDDDKRSLNYQR